MWLSGVGEEYLECSRPRVSVVVPAFNSAWSIGRTLEAITRQSLREFEAIVVDDGSTDDLAAVVQPYLVRDARLRLVRQPNGGLAAARNRGIQESRASLVAPIDADDIWHPDFLRATVEALEAEPEAPFAFAYSFRMDVEDRLLARVTPRRPPRHDFVGLLTVNSVGSGSAATFRRDLLVQAGGYDTAMGRRGVPGAEDWKLVLQLARRGRPILVPRHLVGYRLVKSSMSQKRPERQLDAVMAVLEEVAASAPDVPPTTLADSRTMMTAYLVPAFIRQGQVRRTVAALGQAYGRNPLWFLNPLLRMIHGQYLRGMADLAVKTVRPTRPMFPHLSEVEFEGARPFAYLAAPVVARAPERLPPRAAPAAIAAE